MKVHSNQIARVLSPSKIPSFNMIFEIPPNLYKRIEAPQINSLAQQQLLTELFDVSKSPKQKVVIGSMLLEHQSKLPDLIENRYLRALADSGHKIKALTLYKQSVNNNTRGFRLLGFALLCKCYRMPQAEQFLKNHNIELTSDVILMLIESYAELRQGANVQKWLLMFQKINVTNAEVKKCIHTLLKTKNFECLQYVLESKNDQITSELVAECIAVLPNVNERVLMQVLKDDPNMINIPKFQGLFVNDIRHEIHLLLSKNDSAKAIQRLKDYNGPHLVFLCYHILKVTQKNGEIDILLSRVNGAPPNSMFIEFMLLYFYKTGKDFQKFILEFNLHTTHPSIKGSLTVENYFSLWRLVLRQNKFPVPLRQLLYTTVNCTSLTPQLIDIIKLCLSKVNDFPAIATLYEYANMPTDKILEAIPSGDLGEVLASAEPIRNKLGLL